MKRSRIFCESYSDFLLREKKFLEYDFEWAPLHSVFAGGQLHTNPNHWPRGIVATIASSGKRIMRAYFSKDLAALKRHSAPRFPTAIRCIEHVFGCPIDDHQEYPAYEPSIAVDPAVPGTDRSLTVTVSRDGTLKIAGEGTFKISFSEE
jgi:hypothetical protein